MKKHNASSGFTLIELLVVVVIIGILVGLAVPVLSTILGKGDQVKCLANLRQITIMLTGAAEMEGILPASFDNDAPGGQGMWPYRLVDSGAITTNAGSVGTLVAEEKVFHCPADKPPSGSQQAFNSYTMNTTLSSDSGTWRSFNRPVNVSAHAEVILLAEVHGNRDQKLYRRVFRSNWPEGIGAFDQHNGKANYAFLDGHVEALTFQQTYNEAEDIDLWTPSN